MIIIKLEFQEEFEKTFGPLHIHCFRSPEKECKVLQLVEGDSRFMQGNKFIDYSGNTVRILEFIHGKTLYDSIMEMDIDHEYYYYNNLAPILSKIIGCLEAIQMLHDHGLCHGDIRNDHIMIDHENNEFRWIDFDLCQNSTDFDVLSSGRVLQFVVGMGLNTFHEIRNSGRFAADTLARLQPSDASAFYAYRLMNLRKIYPYIGERLNNVLMHFSKGSSKYYRTIYQVTEDLRGAIAEVPYKQSDQGMW
ncbi:MAG: serine/threonine protein kinase [Dehalococcoidia bacterium]|nr:MAG: serine/threonine protein kinase [Dehalococcoidia bacterium]